MSALFQLGLIVLGQFLSRYIPPEWLYVFGFCFGSAVQFVVMLLEDM